MEKKLQITKEDVRGAYKYYGLFYMNPNNIISKMFIARTDKAGEKMLCYDFIKGTWEYRFRNAFYERLNGDGFDGEISELSETDALWFLEQHKLSENREAHDGETVNEHTAQRNAFNGEGDDEAVNALLAKWAGKAEEYRAEFNNGWPAKNVETTFYLNGKQYSITPESIGLKQRDSWDEGLLEYMQSDIERDLRKLGATDIRHMGFLD